MKHLTFDRVDKEQLTPMMLQLIEEKEKYPDCLIFFRLGDFYELFFDDALVASRELELALTGRECGMEERAPMCGVPHHAADSYLRKLLARGYKVAICDQVEDPAEAKGLVERQVVRVLTPGTLTDPQAIDAYAYRYLCAVCQQGGAFGLAACDLSSGRFETTELLSGRSEYQLFDELARLKPVEYVINESFLHNKRFKAMMERNPVVYTVLPDQAFTLERARERNLDFTEAERMWPLASAALLAYLEETQKQNLAPSDIQPYVLRDYMLLDRSSRSNLELTETIRDRKRQGSLLWAIDRTGTAMGARLLRAWIEQPLIDTRKILRRQASVAALYETFVVRESLREALKGLYDMERLSGRIASSTVTPRELVALRSVLVRIPPLKALLADLDDPGLQDLQEAIFDLADLEKLLSEALVDEPPITLTEGGIFRPGFHAELDEYTQATEQGRDYILSLEAKEREATGIRNLKVGFNRVFGYYYEVSRGQVDKVPDYFTRKQTLVNSERYITPELKEKEDRILGADQKKKALEYQLFTGIRDQIAQSLPKLRSTAGALAELDVYLSLSDLADRNKYCRPDIHEGISLSIQGGRHAVVEQILKGKSDFIANDLDLDQERRSMILTGPNMSGKSTYMRQAAIIVLLAQIGSFVPARSASVGIVDRIMTRVGASDDLAGGQSTFMVEMSEVASILDQATPRSFLILDEIGRGTGTADGLSIAWSVMEFISDPALLGARSLFATHYHELIDLGNRLPGAFNAHFTVAERDGDMVFLHQVQAGGASESYGIEVAKLAGLPGSVLDRAREIMAHLEQSGQDKRAVVKRQARTMDGQQDLFSGAQSVRIADEMVGLLDAVDVDQMRPVDAYGLLLDLKELAARKKRLNSSQEGVQP